MENLPTLSEIVLQDMPIDFFDFTFIINSDGTMKECQYGETVLVEELATSLRTIREKYMKKTRQHKEDKKKLKTENAKLKDRIITDENFEEKLDKENKKLREEKEFFYKSAKQFREDNEKVRAENEYLHQLLPEADGYIIEKQLEKRLWNDGEEDVYD